MLCLTCSGRKALEDQHAQCLSDNKAAVASATDTLDLLLVAQTALDGTPAQRFLSTKNMLLMYVASSCWTLLKFVQDARCIGR